MASAKVIELEEQVENAATDALNCAEKLGNALRILKKIGERPVNMKELEKLKAIADNFAEDLAQMAEDITDSRMNEEEEDLDEEIDL